MEKKTGYLLILIIAMLSCAAMPSRFLTLPAPFTGTPEVITIETTPK
jgi:hypothetical protein